MLLQILDFFLFRPTNNTASTSLPSTLQFQDLRIQQTIARLRLPRMWSSFLEQDFNFFQSLAGCLRIRDECLSCCSKTENAENNKELPGDVLESWWNEESNCEVEEPVGVGLESTEKYDRRLTSSQQKQEPSQWLESRETRLLRRTPTQWEPM
jgi:hypothetical protein